ncbi:cytochrome P450 [Mycena pura]|uniref:Cytochrome P450 n=1 Tax=Mycena pura TaxID=153505 RepID=A0AAD6V5Z8_9AGAR|nr:cytochrome P450 [Mycena pura]
MSPPILIPIIGSLASYLLFRLAEALYVELASPLRNLPGPNGGSLLYGHFRQLEKDVDITHKWCQEFGRNFQVRGLLNKRELFTADTRALNHILVNDSIYQKGPIAQKILSHFLGNSVLVAEMDEHKRMNPAFGVAQIRQLAEIFNDKSAQLRDIWLRQIAAEHGVARIDTYAWLRKATLDIIGQAGFHYDFNALEPKGEPNELDEAITHLFHSSAARRRAVFRFIRASFPLLSLLPDPGGKVQRDAHETLLRVSHKLLSDSKAAVKASGSETSATGRDLLSILVKANMSDDIPDHQRLSDADVIAQVPTFLIAGHETTSTATAWVLHALSLHPAIQTKLRGELQTLRSECPTMDELNSLPYLEHVIRETMRVYPPVLFTIRTAMTDDVLPLSKPYVDRTGKLYSTISIPKGTAMRIPVSEVHSDTAIWGDDAHEFRPERWDCVPEAASAVPSVWANLLTFLAGTHNCIGFRFSLFEMKALLFALVRAFEFEAALPPGEISCAAAPVRRPLVRSEPKAGSQLPLVVRPVRSS